MRAMAVTAYGEPLEKMDVEEPRLREGHALVEVLTCGICFSDVKTVRGKMPYSGALKLPHVPGHEICARVLASDPPGAIAEGTRVVLYHVWPCGHCARCRAGRENICAEPDAWMGFTHPGGFQERLVVPLDRLAEVPEHIHPKYAASMTCALGTAYRAVISQGRVSAGMRAVIIGLGGVGIHALQIARALGARAVGLDLSGPALDAAHGLGLEARPNDVDAVERVLAETGGEGADVVVDVVGHEDTMAQAEKMVRPGGRIVGVGYGVGSDFVLPSARFVLEEVELVGSRYVLRDELERAIRLVADGKVSMVVDSVRPLEQANEAIEDLEAGKIVGRAVLDVGGVA